jgi:hypothetical protein
MKTAKPFGILALIAIIAALAFTACQDGYGNNVSGYGDTSKFAGTKWKSQSDTLIWDDNNGSIGRGLIISFTNVFFEYEDYYEGFGTYKIEGKRITCTASPKGSNPNNYYVKTFEIIDETTLLDVRGIKWTKL